MMDIIRGTSRGTTQTEWLNAKHTFSFGNYYDQNRMGFGSLRVLNDDRIAPGGGFGMHPHKEMEIVTYVITGTLAHRDSIGNEALLRAGELQRMSAGTGVRHSEYNHSSTDPLRLIQIWIIPAIHGVAPGYEELRPNLISDGTTLVASPTGESGSMLINQDVKISLGRYSKSAAQRMKIEKGERCWIQVVNGSAAIDNTQVTEGDGIALDHIEHERELVIEPVNSFEFLAFHLR